MADAPGLPKPSMSCRTCAALAIFSQAAYGMSAQTFVQQAVSRPGRSSDVPVPIAPRCLTTPVQTNLSPTLALSSGALLGLIAGQRGSARHAVTKRRVAPVATPVEVNTGNDEMMMGMGGGGFGGYTSSNVASRRVVPTDKQREGRTHIKIVYVVLESQYQASMTSAVKMINKSGGIISVECVGYLLEELRSPESIKELEKDLDEANVFICSLIFVQELAEKLVQIVEPRRNRLDACLCFPSMPEVMKLNKLGTFDLTSLSGGPLGSFAQQIKDIRQKSLSDKKPGSGGGGGSFQDSLLKLVRTLPKVLKFLPGDQARDARTFVLSLQHWLGGTPENLEAMLMRIAGQYVSSVPAGMLDVDRIMEPVVLPDMGIWHPCSPAIFDTMAEYQQWYENIHCPMAGISPNAPFIGVILQKSHIATKDDGHYVGFVQECERRGAKVACVYTGGLDFSVPVVEYLMDSYTGEGAIDTLVNLTGFSLVGGPASQDAKKAKEVLMKVNRPYMVSIPCVFQSFTEWQNSQLGLHPVQVALQVSLPEIDGAIEPLIFSGRDGTSGRSIPMQDRLEALATRALNWARLRKKQNAEKKLCICLFQFPPDKGNVGTAAYLDVFGSIYSVLCDLKKQGYTIDDLPDSVEGLQKTILQNNFASSELNVEYRMSCDEYQELCPYAKDLYENWGPPPGKLNTDGKDMLIYGKRFGNVFLGVQPTFGYEGDPMRLLFAKSASPHHGFAAFYTYLESVFKADALLHFGTHGSLEFMPGKQVGMSGSCYPDRLISVLPNLYYYAANNPSEATIAKRRSYASTISYLTPPAENSGLYKGLQELSELVKSYQGLRDNEQRGASIVNTIVATARTCNLDKDIDDLPTEEQDMKEVSLEVRDSVVGKVYRRLMEIESRALPMGLHRIGVPPSAPESVATLVNIAQLDRPELKVKSLLRIIAESVGKDMETIYRNSDKGVLEDVNLLQSITLASRAAVGSLVKESTNSEGRVEKVNPFLRDVFSFFGGGSPWKKALAEAGYPSVNEDDLKPLFNYLEVCLEQIVCNNELPSLVKALDGKFIEPGPGGDPIRNPDVLPTGKNMHALDPQSIPTKAAADTAFVVVDRLLEGLAKQGPMPESIAFTLWGTDNIKTYGESLAQVLALVGCRPVPDSLGRVNKVELIPLEKLKRPRIDVVCNCSGVFRDLFINQMNLLDRAIKMAAEADEPLEMNFVRKHSLEAAAEMNISLRQAATRVFSNAAGSYSANVGLAIENGANVDEAQLQEQFTSRKGFALSSDNPGELTEASGLFKRALSKVDVTFQNLDSSEISLTDVSHYFDSDPTKVVESLRKDGKKVGAYIADTTTANAQVRSLSAQVRLDSRTKLLNPKFYEAALKGGYEGVREITKRMRYTFGWSTTAGAVDNFVYEDANTTYIADDDIKNKMLDKNPNALRDMVQTFLEANSKGYWDTSEENIERLKQVYQECEDKIEGVDFIE